MYLTTIDTLSQTLTSADRTLVPMEENVRIRLTDTLASAPLDTPDPIVTEVSVPGFIYIT